jgi:stage IV sporulation protein FB
LFLVEPPQTAFDVHFRVFGIPVRISAWFWLGCLLLGWEFAMSLKREGVNTGVGLLVWSAAVLISILVHELGHALTFRYFGVASHIVLYHLGGLAIPERGFGSYGRQVNEDPRKQILISLAGPVAQMVFAILVIGAVLFAGYAVPNPLPFIHYFDFLKDGKPLADISIAFAAFMYAFVFVSIAWALLNLLPIYPLDGGQISREVFTLSNPREGIRFSLILSIGVAIGVALWFWKQDDKFAAVMFGVLAYSSFMTLQAYLGAGRGSGRGQW